MIPTRSQHEIKDKFTRPDWVTLKGANVFAGFHVTNPPLNQTVEQKYKPEQIHIDAVPPMGTVQVRWLVANTSHGEIIYDSQKAGVVTRDF